MNALKLVETTPGGGPAKVWYVWYDEADDAVRYYYVPNHALITMDEIDLLDELIEHLQCGNQLSVVEVTIEGTSTKETLVWERT